MVRGDQAWRTQRMRRLFGLWASGSHLSPLARWLRCRGSRAALCNMGGWKRGGILRQYCWRLRWHPGRCLAPISADGEWEASWFVPEPEER